jgi:hypothetical protein
MSTPYRKVFSELREACRANLGTPTKHDCGAGHRVLFDCVMRERHAEIVRNELQCVAGQGWPKSVRDSCGAVVVQFRALEFVVAKCVPEDANIETRIVSDQRHAVDF